MEEYLEFITVVLGPVMKEILNLTAVMIWPAVVLVTVFVFKAPIKDFILRIKSVEGPGETKFFLSPSKLATVLEKGINQKRSPQELAQEIFKIARDHREKRILRALLDDRGRAIYNYQRPYYKQALDSLVKEGLVEKVDNGKGYGLTEQGYKVTKEYLEQILAEDATISKSS